MEKFIDEIMVSEQHVTTCSAYKVSGGEEDHDDHNDIGDIAKERVLQTARFQQREIVHAKSE